MNYRTILALPTIAVLALALLPGTATSQTKSLKEQLVGTWTLVSAESVEPDGRKAPLVNGANMKGQQIFTDAGRISLQIVGDHSKVASNDRLKMTADEMKDTAESILSYFGTYTVDEGSKTYTIKMEGSSFANQLTAPAKRNVTMNGDEMTVTNADRLAGGQTIIVWKRAK